MPKVKREPSAKQLAAREKFAQAARERARLAKEKGPQPQEDTISHDDYADLKRQIEELKALHWQAEAESSRVALQGGRLIGTVEKYNLTPNHYPNPVDRLSQESRLARFAFPINYLLDFKVAISEYTTLDGIRTKEPKFTLTLVGYVDDEESGERVLDGDGNPITYVICRLIMHEDPEAALVIAREQHLDVDEENEEAFLNEMRYIRMRDFLLKCFYPERPKDVNRKTEMVVGGKIVEIYQVTKEETDKTEIPYGKIAGHKL